MCSSKEIRFLYGTQRGILIFSLIFFFTFSNNCHAQATYCDHLLTTKIDSLSEELLIHAKKNIVVSQDGRKTGFTVYGAYEHQTIILTIRSFGAGACVNEGDKVHFVFTDSTKLELANMAEFNCQAQSSIYFNNSFNNTKHLHLLAEKQISKITVWTKNKFLARNVSDSASAKIRELFSCLHAVFNMKPKVVEDKIFTIVEQQPEFIGGHEAMLKFLKKNNRYSDNARRKGIHGAVYVSFVVGKDGSIGEVKVIRGLSADLDQEAIRVVSMMPQWRPGMQNGKPVYVRFILPVQFN